MYLENISEQNRAESVIEEEQDQFQLLEDKIDRLIKLVGRLREDKASLEKKVEEQEQLIEDLQEQIKKLQADKERARERISYVLSKIDQIDTEENGE